MLKQLPRLKRKPVPKPIHNKERSDYQYQAYAALHSAGIHIHFSREWDLDKTQTSFLDVLDAYMLSQPRQNLNK